MIEKQPYEKHLANELEQLPPMGDAAQHWPDMKARLDRDMPEGGAWFSGWRRWGGLLLLLLLLLTGWWFVRGYETDTKEVATVSTKTPAPENTGMKNSSSPTEEGIKSSAPASETRSVTNNKADNIEDPQPPVITATNAKQTGGAPVIVKEESRSTNVDDQSSLTATSNKTDSKLLSSAPSKTRTKYSPLTKQDKSGSKVLRSKTSANYSETNETFTGSIQDKSASTAAPMSTDAFAPVATRINAPKYYYAWNTGLLLTDSMPVSYSASINGKLKPTPKRSRFKEVTERTQKLHNREVGSGDAKKFVFGLALPLAFPISDQKAVAYNFNGGQNTVSDYVPTPHVQYHFGKESFLQAEMQFINPQFIRPALLSQLTREQAAPGNNRYVTTSIFAKKLYYFNLPVSVYYSPFKNFYLGTGLQFSSLLSGIAYSEYRAGNSMMPQTSDTLLRYSYSKFRNDTLSGRLNSNEFRVLLDAQYYWKRFAVGMRYNQGLGNYINLQVSPNMPNVIDRNRALQFYLRYNLWEKK